MSKKRLQISTCLAKVWKIATQWWTAVMNVFSHLAWLIFFTVVWGQHAFYWHWLTMTWKHNIVCWWEAVCFAVIYLSCVSKIAFCKIRDTSTIKQSTIVTLLNCRSISIEFEDKHVCFCFAFVSLFVKIFCLLIHPIKTHYFHLKWIGHVTLYVPFADV